MKIFKLPSLILATCFASVFHLSAQAVESTFITGTENWALVAMPNHPESDGYVSPDPGPAIAFDSGGGDPDGAAYWGTASPNHFVYFSAPAAFLGNLTNFINGTLNYETRHSRFGTGISEVVAGVVLVSNGRSIVTDSSSDTMGDNVWKHHTVLFNAHQGWYFDHLGGAQVSTEDLLSAMTNVSALYIRAEFFNGDDDCFLDNVALYPLPTNSLPPFSCVALAGTNNTVRISWLAQSGHSYVVQYRNSLNSGSWIDVGSPVTGIGAQAFVEDAIVVNEHRFYRVLIIK